MLGAYSSSRRKFTHDETQFVEAVADTLAMGIQRRESEDRTNATNALLKLFTQTHARQDYLDAVVGLIQDWSDCGNVGIRLLNKHGEIPFEAHVGMSDEFLADACSLSLDDDECICTRVIREDTSPHDAECVTQAGSFRTDDGIDFASRLPENCGHECRAKCMGLGLRSLALIPIRHRDAVIGAMYIADQRPGKASAKVVEFIESVAPLVGEAVHRFEVEEDLRRHSDTQAAVGRILRLSLKGMALDQILQRTTEIIQDIPWVAFDAGVGIFLTEKASQTLVMAAQKGLPESVQDRCKRVPWGLCHCVRTAETGEAGASPAHAPSCGSCDLLDAPHRLYSVPIRLSGEILGVISVLVDGDHRWSRAEEELLGSAAGALAGIIARKRSEEEKEHVQAQLFHSQKMESIGVLAGGIAHDFNNLLTAIIGYSGMALADLDDGPVRDGITEVYKAGERASVLTRQLLAFSRRQMLQPELMDVNNVTRDMKRMLERLVGENVTVIADLAANLMSVKADSGQLDQVIMNLCVNARDAMPQGGSITIRSMNATLDEAQCRERSGLRPGKYVCLQVADTGTGMDKATVSQIFDPFFTTKEAGAGTGLGLSTVYGIVKQHDGHIHVESRPGQGATFTVYLPAADDAAGDETEAHANSEVHQGRGQHVLLVEDAAGVREFAQNVLAANGYSVTAVASAEEAFEAFETENGSFSVVFSDVMLPGENGVELVGQLLSRNPDLGVLMTSGYADERSKWATIHDKGYHFIQKPYGVTALTSKLQDILRLGKQPATEDTVAAAAKGVVRILEEAIPDNN